VGLFIGEKTMIDTRKLDDLVKGISEALPPGVHAFQQDIEKNIKAALTSTFAKLDLVTREEFDIQTEVLRRTREKLEALEQRVTELETK
jgi:hypothetical protein